MRVGQGFDAHRFDAQGSAGSIRLGGIDVPYDRAVIAHSDGDVLLHALVDALLGAAGLGDIGQQFPDSDPSFKGASSVELLEQVVRRLEGEDIRVVNADLTLIGEAPRIGRYRDAMVANISAVLGIPVSMVGVKATTTEGMGFTGRGEGIAAMAVVLVEKARR